MKAVYPVLFTKTDDAILIEVPDLEILTEGKDLTDAIDMARDAIELKCVSLEDDKINIPVPSKLSEINIKNATFKEDGETFASLVDIDSMEYRRKIDTKTIRKNVTLPSWLNYEAEQSGINFSKTLQDALIGILGVKKLSKN